MKGTMSDATKQRRVEERGLIEKCKKLALKGRMAYRNTRDCRTHVKWEYKGGGLEVFFESGTFHLGNGEEIIVTDGGKEVFHVYDGATKKCKCPLRSTFQVGETHVEVYEWGPWEEKMDGILSQQS
jgi:hypothetical protein